MEEEKVKKLKGQFKKVYLDTKKHEADIEKWIRSGKRKKGDIRRSLQKLSSKYQNLIEVKRKLEERGIEEKSVIQDESQSLLQIEDNIKKLNKMANTDSSQNNEKDNNYHKKIELVNDIQGGIFYTETIKKNKMYFKSIHNYRRKIKGFKKSISRLFSVINRKNKKNVNKYKKVGRISAMLMAGALAIFGGTTAGESDPKTNESNTKSYVDTVDATKANNEFKNSLFVQVLEDSKCSENAYHDTTIIVENKEKATNPQNIEKNKVNNKKNYQEKTNNINMENEESADNVYTVRRNTKYTEISTGNGKEGYFLRDTSVIIYNRALVKTDRQGNKSILNVTKAGQTWKEFAEEQGINYKEFKSYFENNPNIQEMVSIDREDGKESYGWVSKDKLEKVEEIEK